MVNHRVDPRMTNGRPRHARQAGLPWTAWVDQAIDGRSTLRDLMARGSRRGRAAFAGPRRRTGAHRSDSTALPWSSSGAGGALILAGGAATVILPVIIGALTQGPGSPTSGPSTAERTPVPLEMLPPSDVPRTHLPPVEMMRQAMVDPPDDMARMADCPPWALHPSAPAPRTTSAGHFARGRTTPIEKGDDEYDRRRPRDDEPGRSKGNDSKKQRDRYDDEDRGNENRGNDGRDGQAGEDAASHVSVLRVAQVSRGSDGASGSHVSGGSVSVSSGSVSVSGGSVSVRSFSRTSG